VAPATRPDIAEENVDEALKEAETTLEQTASEPVLHRTGSRPRYVGGPVVIAHSGSAWFDPPRIFAANARSADTPRPRPAQLRSYYEESLNSRAMCRF
jgi:hypothetical protein